MQLRTQATFLPSKQERADGDDKQRNCDQEVDERHRDAIDQTKAGHAVPGNASRQ